MMWLHTEHKWIVEYIFRTLDGHILQFFLLVETSGSEVHTEPSKWRGPLRRKRKRLCRDPVTVLNVWLSTIKFCHFNFIAEFSLFSWTSASFYGWYEFSCRFVVVAAKLSRSLCHFSFSILNFIIISHHGSTFSNCKYYNNFLQSNNASTWVTRFRSETNQTARREERTEKLYFLMVQIIHFRETSNGANIVIVNSQFRASLCCQTLSALFRWSYSTKNYMEIAWFCQLFPHEIHVCHLMYSCHFFFFLWY